MNEAYARTKRKNARIHNREVFSLAEGVDLERRSGVFRNFLEAIGKGINTRIKLSEHFARTHNKNNRWVSHELCRARTENLIVVSGPETNV